MKDKLNAIAKLMNPFYSFAGRSDIMRHLPRLNSNDRANLILWNTLVAGGTFGGAFALIKALANETHKEQWERKQKEALATKLNSIMPAATPDTSITEDEKKQRAEAKAIANNALMLEDSIEKQANSVGDLVLRSLAPVVPVAVAGGASILGAKAVYSRARSTAVSDIKSTCKI